MKQEFEGAVVGGEENKIPAAEAAMMGGTEESTSVAIRGTTALGEVGGDVDLARDIQLPRLMIGSGQGKYGTFAKGSLLIATGGAAELVVPAGTDVKMVFLSLFKYWKEWLPGELAGAGVIPRNFRNEAEAQAAGLSLDWDGKTPPGVARAMDAKCLIEKPDGLVSSSFCITLDGKEYAPAVWSIDKMAYKNAGPTLLMASAGVLKTRGLLSGLWSLKVVVATKGTKSWGSPVLRLVGATSPGFIDSVKEQIGGMFRPVTEPAGAVDADASAE